MTFFNVTFKKMSVPLGSTIMNTGDEETLKAYIDESLEHLAGIETDFLEMEKAGSDIDVEQVNKVFRAAHSIKGGAGFMGLENIKTLSHHMENVLGLMRNGKLVPNPENINFLLLASDYPEKSLNPCGNQRSNGHFRSHSRTLFPDPSTGIHAQAP